MKNDQKNCAVKGLEVSRRKIFGWFWKILAAVACIEFGWLSVSIFRSRKRQFLQDRKQGYLLDAGMVDQFEPGAVKAIPEGQLYLVRLEDGSFMALSRTCTHLGCSVPWDEERRKFVCPCHGSTFDRQGLVLTPPAVRPLDYYHVKIENGLIRVDVSKPLRREVFDPSQVARV